MDGAPPFSQLNVVGQAATACAGRSIYGGGGGGGGDAPT